MTDSGKSRLVTESVHLSEHEVASVARRLVAEYVTANPDGIAWEDNPMFDEATWEAIDEAINAYATDLRAVADRYDQATDIDSHYLIGLARQ